MNTEKKMEDKLPNFKHKVCKIAIDEFYIVYLHACSGNLCRFLTYHADFYYTVL